MLTVNDDASSRLMLRNTGHFVAGQADKGVEGLRLAVRSLPTLMLLDIDTPLIERLVVLINARWLHPRLSVLAVSGLDPAIYPLPRIRLGVHGV